MDKYYVYRFKNTDGFIVYVGKTKNLKQRFKQHEHLTEDVNTIEYIECSSEADMMWKEIYYINLFKNENTTNAASVCKDKPTDLYLDDIWIKYHYVHRQSKKTRKNNLSMSKNISLNILKDCGHKCYAVYSIILSHKNKRYDSCYPSLDLLEKELNISRTALKTCIKTLVDAGYLAIESGRFGKNSYYFFLQENFYNEEQMEKIRERANRIKEK